MATWSDNFEDSRDLPDREEAKSDQEKGLMFDDHVKRLIEEYDNSAAKRLLLREIRAFVGPDNDEDILYQGLGNFWKGRAMLKPDATVADVSRVMRTICHNLIKSRHRHAKLIKWLPLSWKTKDHNGNEVEKERVYLDGFEEAMLQKLHDRTVMEEILRHFPKEEDRQCIEFILLGMKPREVAALLHPDSAEMDRQKCAEKYRKQRDRILARMRVILAEMEIQ